MTPREKASELIVNYQLKCKSLNYEQAKECALIAVDEIIAQIEPSVTMDVISARIEYWQEVKNEINKL